MILYICILFFIEFIILFRIFHYIKNIENKFFILFHFMIIMVMYIILCLIILLLYIYVVYHISDMCMILQ